MRLCPRLSSIAATVAFAAVALGCGDDSATGPSPAPSDAGTECAEGEVERPDGSCEAVGPGPTTCSPGELELDDGTCQPAGLPADLPCPPGEHATASGCATAGIPADGCGEGFLHDGGDGCEPVLPSDPCPAGQLALPGETSCRAVAACGSGVYGDIPIDGTTQFVDAAYAGGSSDGTIDHPWTTVTEGYAAAAPGAIVAVAAGSYPGSLTIQNKPVRLWGRCPSMVHLEGQPGGTSSVYVWSGASGTELHGVSITGPGYGVNISDAEQVLLEKVRIHDNEVRGLAVHDLDGPASATVRASLIEHNVAQAAFVRGAELAIEDSVLRDTLQHPSGATSCGVAADCQGSGSNEISLRHSLLERNISAGLLAACADVSVTDTVIRDQVVDPNGQGIGIDVAGGDGDAAATLALSSSALLDNNNIGVALRGVVATIDDTVIRGTGPRPGGGGGHGINMRDDEVTGRRADLTLRTSSITENTEIGVFVYGSDAAIEDTVVRGTQPNASGFGIGVQLEQRPDDGARAAVVVRRSIVEDAHTIGLYATGSELAVDASVVRGTVEGVDFDGAGLYAAASSGDSGRTRLDVTRSQVDHNVGANVMVWGADLTVAQSVVQDAVTAELGRRGHGVVVYDSQRASARATVTVLGTRLERNHTFGIATAGEDALFDGVVVRDTRVAPLGDSGFGVAVINVGAPGTPVSARLRNTRVAQSRDLGIYAYGAEITVEGCAVTNTASDDNGLYGDGICFDSSADFPTRATVTDTTVTESARAAILNFGSQVALGRTLLLCQTYDLDGEHWDTPFQFEDLGGNGCGCPAPAAPCQVLSATLRPPEAAPPPDEGDELPTGRQ